MFRAAKDKLTSEAIRSQINRRFARYGTLQSLKVDSRHKTISAGFVLRGETEETFLLFRGYNLHDKDGKTWLEVKTCSCDRAWMQHAIEDHVCSRPFDVPAAARYLL
ncbi:MAG: hypothetical protein ACREIA_08385 [Opitutaceae bacterium]